MCLLSHKVVICLWLQAAGCHWRRVMVATCPALRVSREPCFHSAGFERFSRTNYLQITIQCILAFYWVVEYSLDCALERRQMIQCTCKHMTKLNKLFYKRQRAIIFMSLWRCVLLLATSIDSICAPPPPLDSRWEHWPIMSSLEFNACTHFCKLCLRFFTKSSKLHFNIHVHVYALKTYD